MPNTDTDRALLTLIAAVDDCFPAATRKLEIREEINEFGLQINDVYETAAKLRPVPPQAEINEGVHPLQRQIDLLRAEDRKLDDEIQQVELAVHDALKNSARYRAAVMAQLEQFSQVLSLRGSPIEHLLKLKSL